MRGIDLHNKLKSIELEGEKINFTELAKSLGFNNVQALYSKLKAKRLDDDFVKEVANKVGVDIWVFSDHDEPYQTKTVNNPDYLQMLVESQQEQIRLHKKVEALHDKIIAFYEAGK